MLASIKKIAINSAKHTTREEKNENKSAEVEQMSEKSIVVLFYYFSCVIHLDVKKTARENIALWKNRVNAIVYDATASRVF